MAVPVFDGWFDWVLVKREGAIVVSSIDRVVSSFESSEV